MTKDWKEVDAHKNRKISSNSCYLFINVASCINHWSERLGFNPRSSLANDSKKWFLMPPWLTLGIIRYR